ncbi:hypothetical protein PR048_014736 [Dryococelus australis]|uniref:Uncharacterized protein n=1 Tax=Dryococelus australis TaxID=614101 RepID=A0ABQ9HF67_9NEOP|nr:hypothetical protein PR048_014736 [Dryococelus australis]
MTNEVLLTVKGHFKRPSVPDDRIDVFGKSVAIIILCSLPKHQMLIAKKIINDTLFQAEMGVLPLPRSLIGEAIPDHYQQQFDQHRASTESSTSPHLGSPNPCASSAGPSEPLCDQR